jgi:hypothetical protein
LEAGGTAGLETCATQKMRVRSSEDLPSLKLWQGKQARSYPEALLEQNGSSTVKTMREKEGRCPVSVGKGSVAGNEFRAAYMLAHYNLCASW